MSDVPADSAGQESTGGLQRPVPVVALAGAVVALVVGLVIGSTLGDQEESAAVTSPTTTGEADPTTTTTSDPTTTTTEVPEPELGSRENPVPVGTPFELGGARITVTSIDLEADTWLVDHDDRNPAPEPGWRYVIFHRTVENIGDDGFTPFLHPLATGAGSEHYPSTCIDLRYWPDDLADEPTIYPGGQAQGNTCLRVPVEEIDSREFLIEFSASPDRVYVTP